MKLGQIQSCGGLSVAEFHERCVAPSVPVVLKGYAGDWPALRLWSFANLRQQFGQLRITVRGSDQAVQVFFGKVTHLEMTLAQYLEAILQPPHGGPRPYFGNVLLSATDAHARALFEQFQFPRLFPQSQTQTRIWIAGRGQQSTIHNDNYENLNAQIVGNKVFTLYPPGEFPKLYAQRINDGLWASPVDPCEPDLERYPRFADLEGIQCVLEPGDLLYIPRFWWHQAAAPRPCVNLNCWHNSSEWSTATWVDWLSARENSHCSPSSRAICSSNQGIMERMKK